MRLLILVTIFLQMSQNSQVNIPIKGLQAVTSLTKSSLLAILKPLQNKKGQKKIPGAPFSVSFSQLPAVKKIHFGKLDKQIFGPSYFVTALVAILI